MKQGKIAAKALFLTGAFIFVISAAYGATLTATPDHAEFGTIDEGVNAAVTVVIENKGSSPVEITNVQTS
ncbi:MAG: DUF1573 domain-containing protein [Acidobacteriota bacterium]|jgi:hypothetical protein|nr:DUF1573 domain-containing protein [Acidobacteriota bacterium]